MMLGTTAGMWVGTGLALLSSLWITGSTATVGPDLATPPAPARLCRPALILRCEPQVFDKDQPVVLWVAILNKGPHDLLLGDGLYSIQFTDPRGRHVAYPGEELIPELPPPPPIEGGWWYSILLRPNELTGCIRPPIRLKPGTYFARAATDRYDMHKHTGIHTWAGSLVSNRVRIVVRSRRLPATQTARRR